MTAWYRWLAAPIDVLALATGAKAFNANPVMANRWLNRRGLHVTRRVIAGRLGVLRRRRLAGLIAPEDRTSFDAQGYLVKPDFLPADAFRTLVSEITALETQAREFIDGSTMTRLIPLDTTTLTGLPAAQAFLADRRYRGLLAYVGTFRRRPHVLVQTVFSRIREAPPDVQSHFHSDTFHPTVKAWLFLNDVEAENAAFTYVPGSHRTTRRRLAWERRVSMTAAAAGDRLTAEGSFRIAQDQIRRLGYPEPQRLAAKANTLIVADTSGFHARGIPELPSTRLALWAYSRSNPFLPWTGGDLAALPFIAGRAVRAFWTLQDLSARLFGAAERWRWAGIRSPLGPPHGERDGIR